MAHSGGYRVLLVEDEFLIGLLIEDMLADLGSRIAETATGIAQALASAQSGAFDLALLDLTLSGTDTYPVADILKRRGIPFAFVTGYDAAALDPAYADVPVLHKPFRRTDLAAMIARLVAG